MLHTSRVASRRLELTLSAWELLKKTHWSTLTLHSGSTNLDPYAAVPSSLGQLTGYYTCTRFHAMHLASFSRKDRVALPSPLHWTAHLDLGLLLSRQRGPGADSRSVKTSFIASVCRYCAHRGHSPSLISSAEAPLRFGTPAFALRNAEHAATQARTIDASEV